MDRYEQRRYEDNEGDRYDVINHTPTHDELADEALVAMQGIAHRVEELRADDAPYCNYCERTGHTFSTCPDRDDDPVR